MPQSVASIIVRGETIFVSLAVESAIATHSLQNNILVLKAAIVCSNMYPGEYCIRCYHFDRMVQHGEERLVERDCRIKRVTRPS